MFDGRRVMDGSEMGDTMSVWLNDMMYHDRAVKCLKTVLTGVLGDAFNGNGWYTEQSLHGAEHASGRRWT